MIGYVIKCRELQEKIDKLNGELNNKFDGEKYTELLDLVDELHELKEWEEKNDSKQSEC